MSYYCDAHRLPRAGVDPIDSEPVALAMITYLLGDPPRAETIALLLDDQRRGISILVVNGTDRPDALLEVLEMIALADHPGDELGAVIVASVRPGGGVEHGDVDRWLEASDLLADRGVELLEWFVVGAGVRCPRDRLGEPPRWKS